MDSTSDEKELMRQLRQANSEYLPDLTSPSSTVTTESYVEETESDLSALSDTFTEMSLTTGEFPTVNERTALISDETDKTSGSNQQHQELTTEEMGSIASTEQSTATATTTPTPPKPEPILLPKVTVFLAAQASQNGLTNTFAGNMQLSN